MIATTTIKFRRGTTSEWNTANPVLSIGEAGYETNTRKLKVGDGLSRWNALPYLQGSVDAPGEEASVFVQTEPLATWVIAHLFDRLPAVTLYVDGEIVETDVTSIPNQTTVSWPYPISGVAVLT